MEIYILSTNLVPRIFLPGLLIAMHALACKAAESSSLDTCKYKVEPLGCFADDVHSRTMTDQVINERDPTSSAYNGRMIDWMNFESFLSGFICRCATKAFAKGYRVIGIQFYAECYGSLNGHNTYQKLGKSAQCVDSQYKYIGENPILATGKDSTNFVYRIAPTECDTYYEPTGCYKDNQIEPRPLPKYIMNERDYTHSNWNRKLIDWKNWDTYTPKMICRCAKKAQELGYKTFSLQFYGECWSGNEESINMGRDGKADSCIAAKFDPCPYNSYHCIGKEYTNRVYKLIEGPTQNVPSPGGVEFNNVAEQERKENFNKV